MARLGTSLWDWTGELKIFDPLAQGAYDGWAYGPFIVNRFTEWNAATRELGIYYLLSLSTPYQVQLMYTRLHLD